MNLQDQIRNRIRRTKAGKVVIPKDFLDLGSRDAIDQAFSRLAKEGYLQRISRGIYFHPRTNQRWGISIIPDSEEIARAFARQSGSRITPSGAVAANQLGLTSQVPTKPVYLTNGRSKTIRAGNFTLIIKHVAPKEIPIGSRISAKVFQALNHIGKHSVNTQVINQIQRNLKPKDRAKLLRDARYANDWIAEIAGQIAGMSPKDKCQ